MVNAIPYEELGSIPVGTWVNDGGSWYSSRNYDDIQCKCLYLSIEKYAC